MPKRSKLIGRVYGRLTVIGEELVNKPYQGTWWICSCSCGNTKTISAMQLRQGTTKSCGCFRHEVATTKGYGFIKVKHHMTNSHEYSSWGSMIQRCENANHAAFKNYGGRGVKICKEWRNSFETFLKDMGPRPSLKHSLDRFPNNDGNYEPGNCRWATIAEQHLNRRDNRLVTFENETKTLSEWAVSKNIPFDVLAKRIEAGWDVEKALNQPRRATKPKADNSLKELAEKHGFTRSVVQKRLDAGWSLEDALSKKLRVTAPRSHHLPDRSTLML